MDRRILNARNVRAVAGLKRACLLCVLTLATSTVACGHVESSMSGKMQVDSARPAADTIARPADRPALAIACTHDGALVIGGDLASRGKRQTTIDVSSLVVYRYKEGEAVKRVGTNVTEFTCDGLVVAVRGGFYNEDPQGELGAADDYAVVSVHAAGKRIVGPVAIGVCTEGNPRYEVNVPCPAGWATRMDVRPSGDGYRVHLEQGQGK